MRHLGGGNYAINGVVYELDLQAGLYTPANEYQGYKGTGTIDGVNKLNPEAPCICRCGQNKFIISMKKVWCASCNRGIKPPEGIKVKGGKVEVVKSVVKERKETMTKLPKVIFKTEKKKKRKRR